MPKARLVKRKPKQKVIGKAVFRRRPKAKVNRKKARRTA